MRSQLKTDGRGPGTDGLNFLKFKKTRRGAVNAEEDGWEAVPPYKASRLCWGGHAEKSACFASAGERRGRYAIKDN